MPAPVLTAHDVIDQFLSHEAQLVAAGLARPKTLAYYEDKLGRLKPVLPPRLRAKDLRPFHLLRLPYTWHFHQAARRAFTWAWKVGLLKADPLVAHKLPPLGRRERIPTAHERAALLRVAPPYFRDFLAVLWATGARPGELRDLQWAQVSLADGTAEVVDYKAKRRIKNAPPVRVLYLDDPTRELLAAWHAERRPRPTAHVFAGRQGQPLTKNAACLAFRRACKRARVAQKGERLVCYSFRHGRATELTVDGLNTRLLAEFLGHKQERTTYRYQHPKQADVLRRINEIARKGAEDAGGGGPNPPQRAAS